MVNGLVSKNSSAESNACDMLSKRKTEWSRRTSFLCGFRFDVVVGYLFFSESQVGFRLLVQILRRNRERAFDFEGSVRILYAVPPCVWGAYAGFAFGGGVEVYGVILFRVLRELEAVHGSGFGIEADGWGAV